MLQNTAFFHNMRYPTAVVFGVFQDCWNHSIMMLHCAPTTAN